MADLIYRRDAYDVVYKEHCGICTGAILDIPKVEAIPIEWLNQKYAENDPNTHEEDYDYYLWNAIAYILTLWREEQEAKENEEKTDN